jgi:hypothetical protein
MTQTQASRGTEKGQAGAGQAGTELSIGTQVRLTTIGGTWTVIGHDRNGALITCPDSRHTLIIGGPLTSATYTVV